MLRFIAKAYQGVNPWAYLIALMPTAALPAFVLYRIKIMDKIQDLKQKVQDFNMLKLPGQPMMMHMGTSYLVNDLWKRIAELGEAIEEAISSEHDECKVILNKAIGDQEQGDEM